MRKFLRSVKNILKRLIDGALYGKIVRGLCLVHYKLSIKKQKFYNSARKIYYTHTLSECGPGLRIFGKPIIYHPELIKIGKNVTLNNGAQISPRGSVVISDYVTMSRGSQITSGSYDTTQWNEQSGCNYKSHKHIESDVFIGEGAWLCVNSIVLSGVQIRGKGVIVAAGAVVTSDINEDFVVVAGVPARVVKHI